MSLLLSGTDGLSDVDGTAATPAIRGTDTNTGIFFPAADTIAFSEGGAEIARFNSSGNLGIGTASPTAKLHVSTGASGNLAIFTDAINTDFFIKTSSLLATIGPNAGSTNLALQTGGTERARIDSFGNLLVNTTSIIGGVSKLSLAYNGNTNWGLGINDTAAGSGSSFVVFQSNGTNIGNIVNNGNTSVSYNTTSDYRLKENVSPMTGALATVAALKPCTYTWKSNGSAGQGFIAHELQAVVPDCVTGAKDAVETVDDLDAEGRKIGTKEVPRYQGVDTSFLVATLVAAIQEQQATIAAMETRLAALEA